MEEKQYKKKTTVYAFDFDGTLTKKDTLIAFIRYACGNRRFYLAMALFAPMFVLMRLRLYPNWKAKQQFFSWFFKGMDIDAFNDVCKRFAYDEEDLLREKAITQMRTVLQEGSKVIVVSASIENWVRPFFEHEFADTEVLNSGQLQVACTKIDVRQFRVTGKFLTKNCYGREKVKRIDRAFPHRKTYTLIAYGDSAGDKAMLDYADERHYKPFR